MNSPSPSKPLPIHADKVNSMKLYINGKEYPWIETIEIKYGTVDFNTGIVTYYPHGDLENELLKILNG